jgi:hypothetical protein
MAKPSRTESESLKENDGSEPSGYAPSYASHRRKAPNESAAALAGASGAGEATNQNRHGHPNSLSAQRQRILDRLRMGSADTLTLRRELDVLMPAARIHELIHKFGEPILSTRVTRETESGRKHRGIALYALLPGGEGGNHGA